MSDAIANGKYFTIYPEERKKKRKTLDYQVVSKSSGTLLGRIVFYNKWRQHVLEPSSNTLWNESCLTEIHIFLRSLKK